MLIPFDSFPKQRREQWDAFMEKFGNRELDNCNESKGICEIPFISLGENCCGLDEKTIGSELLEFYNTMTSFADGSNYMSNMDDENDHEEILCYSLPLSYLIDTDWGPHILFPLCRGFNHIKNYKTLVSLTEFDGKPIRIVKSLLVLEKKPWALFLFLK